jgi:hypothetical protein
VSNPITTIPRIAVNGYLRAIRLPVTAVERIAHRDSSTPWGPAIAFESFEAKVKGVAGVALRDVTLIEQSSVQTARVEQLRKAAAASAVASAKEAVADRELEERQEAADARREAAESQKESEKERIARQEAEAKKGARTRATRQKRSAARSEQRRKQAAAEKATEVKAETLSTKRDALLERKQAAQAKAAARQIGDAADATRRQRKSS